MTVISIIGSGVVGKATGTGLHRHGNKVIFYDIIREKLVQLRKQGYEVTEDGCEAVVNSSVSFVCVQTPTLNGQTDFSYLDNAIVEIARALQKKDGFHVIAIRSTVLPSTTRLRVIPLLKRHSQLEAGRDYGVCVNPEFLRKKSALTDFLNPWRIVIGDFDNRSGDVLEKLYQPFKKPIIRTDLDTAEMIKYVSNVFLATKISFFNEMHTICSELDLDSDFINRVVALDPRIGKYGIHGGRPFKGRCFPKDMEAFISFIKGNELNPKILDAALHVNQKIARLAAKGEVS